MQRISFSKTLAVLTPTLFFIISKHFEKIFIMENYLKQNVFNLFLVIDVIALKKKIMLKAFLYKISSKFKTLKTNFQYKTSFIIKMSKCEVINSASEDDNNGTEESETSDDEYISDFTKLRP